MAALDRIGKRFRALVELNEGVISLVDANGKSLFRSSSATRITGWTYEELESISVIEHLHPVDKRRVKELMGAILSTQGKPIPVSARFRHRDGHYIWLEGVVTNMLFDPEIGGIIVNLRASPGQRLPKRKLPRSIASIYF